MNVISEGKQETDDRIKRYRELEKELRENHDRIEFLKRRLNELSLE